MPTPTPTIPTLKPTLETHPFVRRPLISPWEDGGHTSFVHALREKHPEILDQILKTSQLSDDNTKALVAAIEEFNKSF